MMKYGIVRKCSRKVNVSDQCRTAIFVNHKYPVEDEKLHLFINFHHNQMLALDLLFENPYQCQFIASDNMSHFLAVFAVSLESSYDPLLASCNIAKVHAWNLC